MDGDGSFLTFCQGQKILNNFHGRDAAVSEIQFLVLDSIFDEVIGVVGFIVEPYDCGDS